jgi:hypothetical protein
MAPSAGVVLKTKTVAFFAAYFIVAALTGFGAVLWKIYVLARAEWKRAEMRARLRR